MIDYRVAVARGPRPRPALVRVGEESEINVDFKAHPMRIQPIANFSEWLVFVTNTGVSIIVPILFNASRLGHELKAGCVEQDWDNHADTSVGNKTNHSVDNPIHISCLT